MEKKTFNLIVAITGGVAAISAGVVAYINPVYTPRYRWCDWNCIDSNHRNL